VRDYVHVADVADAHVAAAVALAADRSVEPVYNLGSGHGVSVLQIMRTVAEVTGVAFAPEMAARRPGDPARIVASGELAARDLGWGNRRSLEDCVRSAWEAWQLAR
jgi:UDP-glucose 4-epimerase